MLMFTMAENERRNGICVKDPTMPKLQGLDPTQKNHCYLKVLTSFGSHIILVRGRYGDHNQQVGDEVMIESNKLNNLCLTFSTQLCVKKRTQRLC